jgi:hypothetical protein
MAETTQDVWDRFERWARRYKKTCFDDIHRLCEAGWCDTSALYLAKRHEIGTDLLVDLNLDASELKSRIRQRIRFIHVYLADISFDGDEFMSKHSRFLRRQYPHSSQYCIGVWLEQSMEDPIEAGSSFLFQDFDASFFIADFSDVDWASMRAVLPFDTMYLRKAGGVIWEPEEAQSITEHILSDIGYDGEVPEIEQSIAGDILRLDLG